MSSQIMKIPQLKFIGVTKKYLVFLQVSLSTDAKMSLDLLKQNYILSNLKDEAKVDIST